MGRKVWKNPCPDSWAEHTLSGKKVPLRLVWRGSSLCGKVLDIMVILIFKTIVMADFYIVLIVYPEPF